MKKIFLVLSILLFVQSTYAQVVINEYSCSNMNTVLDAFGEREDWVELYNTGATNVNLTGYFLSDDATDLQKWAIPAVTDIAPNGRKMIFCSKRDLVHPTGQIHPDFKLRQADQEWFILSNPMGVVVDSIYLTSNKTQINHSRGRTTDGALTWSIFDTPTPNAANVNAKDGYEPAPIFSVAPGNYPAAQNVALSSPTGASIYYTLNGSIPSAASTPYAGPINVAANTSIRAIAISANPLILPSQIETNTYFINENSNFDVISVCGPYTAASSTTAQWLFSFAAPRIWSSFEYFDNNLNYQIELLGRASRHGQDSWAYAQKGIDFEAMDETGTESSFNYKFFGTSLRDKFDRVMMKAGGSDNFPTGFPNNGTHMRDVFAQTLSEKYGLEMDFRRWHPTLMFVNGQYYGLYDLRERVDGDHFEYYYGKKRDKVDHLSYWGGLRVRIGSDTGWNNLYNFITNNNMANQANYDYVKSELNTKSFIQYFILNTFLVNHDWLNWNTMWWRARGNNNKVKWRYVLWDMDAITDLDNANFSNLGTTSFEFDPCEPTSMFQNNSNIKHTDMLTALLNNAEFSQNYRQEWINMFNGPLDCDNLLAHYDSVVNILTPEMARQATQWGGTFADWQTNVAQSRSFLVSRCGVIGQKLDSCMSLNPQRLKLNVSPTNSGIIALDGSVKSPYVWSQVIEADSLYELTATPTLGPYWSFDRWELNNAANVVNPNATTTPVNFGFNDEDSVIAYFKYYNYDSIDVTFDVQPVNTGTIKLDGNLLPSYPYTIRLSRLNSYQIEATPNVSHIFSGWDKNNTTTTILDLSNPNTSFKYDTTDIITANFTYIPPPPPPPNIPEIDRSVFIPNAFSPNGDGNNDEFHVQIGPDVTGLLLTIYDRWGQEIFRTTELRAGWNGTYGDKQNANIGTYQYVLKLRYRDNSQDMHKGDINLIR